MRLLHTSDWHLGHTLHEASREEEHAAFLEWLLDTIEERDVDALLVTGDIFDSSNPPASAQRSWYRFLVAAGQRRPGLRVVAIAGNHDSAARLEAPREVLAALDVTVVGELPRVDGRLDPERLLVPLSDRDGVRRAWVAAVPYLRPSDLAGLPGAGDDEGEALGVDPKATRVAAVYAEAAAAARRKKRDGEAIVLTGHLYAAGTKLSELSERKIQKGNLEAVSLDAFDEDVAYVALGHLHLAQMVGGRENVRYAGSPIPLALSEAGYRHEVVLVELPERAPCGSRRSPFRGAWRSSGFRRKGRGRSPRCCRSSRRSRPTRTPRGWDPTGARISRCACCSRRPSRRGRATSNRRWRGRPCGSCGSSAPRRERGRGSRC